MGSFCVTEMWQKIVFLRYSHKSKVTTTSSRYNCAMDPTKDSLHAHADRKIIHVDMDAFYASVEQHDRPELRGKPIAVGSADGRGVVATASYEARAFGVRSAMASRKAKMLCPQLIFVDGRMTRYKEVSVRVQAIFHRYTDLVEPISIDEAFLDVTDNKKGIVLAVDVARAIKAEIKTELGLTASAGISYNKFLAKIASDWRKPDGLCTIHPDVALDFIDHLKVEHLWGVGPATAKIMHEMGLETAKDIRALPLPDLIRRFGKAGYTYYQFVRGIDDRPVKPQRNRKSVGCEHTYAKDIKTGEETEKALEALTQELMRRLSKNGFVGVTLTLKVRFFNFETLTRSRTRSYPWANDNDVRQAASDLLSGIKIPSGGIRLL